MDWKVTSRKYPVENKQVSIVSKFLHIFLSTWCLLCISHIFPVSRIYSLMSGDLGPRQPHLHHPKWSKVSWVDSHHLRVPLQGPFGETQLGIDKKQLKLPPWRLTWNVRIHPWKRKIIFPTIIFRFMLIFGGVVLWVKQFIQQNFKRNQGQSGRPSWLKPETFESVLWVVVSSLLLVVEPSHLKNMSQNGNLPQSSGVKIKNLWNHHLVICCCWKPEETLLNLNLFHLFCPL